MDLLASLHLEDLPEQQTRISHLSQTLADDPELRLGFNACVACASKSKLSVECRGCRRVKYCSEVCWKQDTSGFSSGEEDALGHSSVICALLKLCEADEDADNPTTMLSADSAAQDRVRSEYESYPTTLANVLQDAPCYQAFLSRASRSKRKELVIHVIGASTDAEIWGKENKLLGSVWDAYADALGQLAESKGLKTVRLHLIGPDCPEVQSSEERRIPLYREDGSSSTFRLLAASHKSLYTGKLLGEIQAPDVVVFFNPGFTCPDYDWVETVSLLKPETAFMVTTNTQMEGIADCQYLLDHKLLPALPQLVSEIVGSSKFCNETEVFFSDNPFAGSRVRQSGSMANDLFVKNSWILGGVFAPPTEGKGGNSKKKATKMPEEAETPKKKHKADPNKKKSNPALV